LESSPVGSESFIQLIHVSECDILPDTDHITGTVKPLGFFQLETGGGIRHIS
jgi:hypothetical protein